MLCYPGRRLSATPGGSGPLARLGRIDRGKTNAPDGRRASTFARRPSRTLWSRVSAGLEKRFDRGSRSRWPWAAVIVTIHCVGRSLIRASAGWRISIDTTSSSLATLWRRS